MSRPAQNGIPAVAALRPVSRRTPPGAVALAVLGVCAALPLRLAAQPLPAQFRGGPAHTGVTVTEGVENLFGLAWRFQTGGTVRSSPTLADGVVYFGSSDGSLYAVDAANGSERWRHDVGSPVGGAAVVTGNLVVFTDRANRVHAVDRATGEGVWRMETGPDLPLAWGHEGWDYLLPSPTLVGETILVGSGDGFMRALARADGTEIWRFRTGGRIRSAPAVLDDVAWFGSGDGIVYAVSVAEGREVARFETPGASMDAADWGFDRTQIQGSPATDGSSLYIGSRDASLYALDLPNLEPRWTVEEGTSWVVLSPAVRNDTVWSGRSGSGTVRAVDARTGREIWVHSTGGLVFSSPVLVDGTLYVASGVGRILALDAADGSVRWTFGLGAGSVSTPAVWNGRLYVGSDDGALYALRAADGPQTRRAVYWDDAMMGSSLWGGQEEHRKATEFFRGAGYEVLDTTGLSSFLEQRIEDGIPSVVVFGQDGLPSSVAGPDGGAPPSLRRYLDAGGKVVWMSYPPGLLVRDPDSGQITGVDRAGPRRILGVDHDAWDSDLYGVEVTEAGRRWGLETDWVGSPSVAAGAPTEVLALDQLGRAAAWVQDYGGRPGTGFVLLRPTTELQLLEEFRRVAEYGVASDVGVASR